MMTPRRSSGCGACIPELTTRRHRGPLLCLGAELKHPHLKGDIDVSPAVPISICLFVGSSPCRRHSRSGIIICNKSYRVDST